ncbi:hypothetical protein O181_029841 [Austropuccinia psidii MF-1]|uniref:Tf2-1-like SH3-like domain-containing protein n=1 Tax=Austropuccinia psidii MF-1 TaxID=1389203 RepID=A0A9Q3CRT4_9BASI|nr:hypothetical protein [Austropuccinia psidii MF-1]
MHWVTALPPSGDKGYNSCLVIVDRYSKTPIFLPCHKDETAMDLSFSTAYHPQTDGVAERRIQTLEDMITRFCAYVLERKDSDGFTHDWWTLIPALELTFKASIILDKVKHNAKQSINDSFDYEKQKWDKIHKVPDFEVGDLVLVSTLNFNKIKWPKKLKDSYVGPFVIVALHETNAVQVELSGKLENKHPSFPVSLINPYQPADKKNFPLKSQTPLTVPPVEQSEDKKIKKVIKERRPRGKN